MYTLPQTLVYEEVNSAVQAAVSPRTAFIAGGHAYLLRYSQPTEQPLGALGLYNEASNQCYSWPQLPLGAVVDESYSKLFVKSAILKYFDYDIGGGASASRVAGYNNRVRSANFSFAANGATYPRSTSVLFDRDVKVGDVARIRAVVGAQSYTLWTYVAGLIGDVVAAVVSPATSDAGNKASQGGPSSSVGMTVGPRNCVAATGSSALNYKGLAAGVINETYTVEVIQSSAGADFTTALLRVTSASGTDDQVSVVPAKAGQPTAIGTRGLTVTWDVDVLAGCSTSAQLEHVSPHDLIVGQTWQVTAHQAFTAPTPTSGGAYAGASNATYLITVTKGGLFSAAAGSQPQITVSTNNGSDASGPTTITAANTAVAIGTQGVTIAFNQTGLCTGDRYYVVAAAQTAGAMKTLVLGNNLNAAIPAGTEVGIQLFINKDLQLPNDRQGAAPLTNWTQSGTQLCTQAGATVYDPSWTNGGVQLALPLWSDAAAPQYSQLFVEYRAWRQDLCSTVGTATDLGTLDATIPGPLTPDNPLKYGVFMALTNSLGQSVKFAAVCNPGDVNSWSAMVALIEGRTDVYGLVPLTHDPASLQLLIAHTNNDSSPTIAAWRFLWVNLQDVAISPILTSANSTDGNPVMATISADPNTAGNPFDILQITSANGPLITDGVRVGDTVRFLFTTDGFGDVTYTSFSVAAVINQDQLQLSPAYTAAVSTPQKVEIWRTLNATDEATAIGVKAGSYANRRIAAVWPDQVGFGGTTFDGYFLCAALAGMVSGVPPHQSLTNMQIQGIDDASRSYKHFNRTQLDSMAGAGTWIVTQDPVTGVVYTRDAITSAYPDANINDYLEVVVRNLDSIATLFKAQYQPYIGIANVTPSMLAVLEAETQSAIALLKGNFYIQRLGPQLIDATIVSIAKSPFYRDRVLITLNLTVPYTLDVVEAHLVLT